MKLLKLEKNNCKFCNMVSGFLDDNNVEYETKNLDVNPEYGSKYQIMGVPVTILLDDEGNEVKRSIGYKQNELEELIAELNQ